MNAPTAWGVVEIGPTTQQMVPLLGPFASADVALAALENLLKANPGIDAHLCEIRCGDHPCEIRCGDHPCEIRCGDPKRREAAA